MPRGYPPAANFELHYGSCPKCEAGFRLCPVAKRLLTIAKKYGYVLPEVTTKPALNNGQTGVSIDSAMKRIEAALAAREEQG